MSQIALFDYLALHPNLRVEVKAASERIKVRMKRTAEDIIEIGKDLKLVKEKLPHGQFLPWINSEFEMDQKTAFNFMSVAEKFGDKLGNFPNFKPSILYQLSAPSTPDEVVEQVMEKAEAGEKVTLKEVKALKAKVASLEAELSHQQDFIQQQHLELETKVQELTESKLEALEAEHQQAILALEAEKEQERKRAKQAELNFQKALEDFKANPDPDTKKRLQELQDTYNRTKEKVDGVLFNLEKLKNRENQAFSAALQLERFSGAIRKVIKDHPDAIVAMSSPYLTDRGIAEMENLAATFEDWAAVMRQSLDQARSSQARQAVEVEVLPIHYFPEVAV
jgi:DNA polymerase III alpha subunit (gram-positive type)